MARAEREAEEREDVAQSPTGRLPTAPAFQNLPVRTDVGRAVLQALRDAKEAEEKEEPPGGVTVRDAGLRVPEASCALREVEREKRS